MKTLQTILITLCISCLSCVLCSAQTDKKTEKPTREHNNKLIAQLPGTWKVQKVYDGKREITPPDSVGAEQFIFDYEGRYKSLSGKDIVDEGSYRLSESTSLLYLESDKKYGSPTSPNQDTWKISIKDSTLTMQGQGKGEAKRFRFVYTKQAEATADKK